MVIYVKFKMHIRGENYWTIKSGWSERRYRDDFESHTVDHKGMSVRDEKRVNDCILGHFCV